MNLKMKPFKALICIWVHHKRWCKSLHYFNQFETEQCPFAKASLLALNPPIIIGKIDGLMIDRESMGLFNTPGAVIQGV